MEEDLNESVQHQAQVSNLYLLTYEKLYVQILAHDLSIPSWWKNFQQNEHDIRNTCRQ